MNNLTGGFRSLRHLGRRLPGRRRRAWVWLPAALAVSLVGYVLVVSRAAAPVPSIEAESGTLLGDSTTVVDRSASGGEYVRLRPGPPARPAFPGAEGFGTTTPGGRGGRVLLVTTLDDSGRGSLRAALEASGPRIVVFRTAGTIELDDEIEITHPYVTVAGQTAPGGGITVRSTARNTSGTLDILTHDVVVRYLRLRSGPHREEGESNPIAIDEGASNVVIDHCSISWGVNENLTSYDETHDITFSWNIISEALRHSSHPEGEHSRGLFISGDGSGDVTAHHNLLAHNNRRNPEVNTVGTTDVVNNVVYNYGEVAAQVSDKREGMPLNFVGNYYKPGPDSDTSRFELDTYLETGSGLELFVRGNIGPHRTSDSRSEASIVEPEGRQFLVEEPAPAPPVTTTSAATAYEEVLAGAGARFPYLDPVDRRVLDDVRRGSGRIIDDPAEVGGWPSLRRGTPPPDSDRDGMSDEWEAARGLDPADDDTAMDRDGDGYTNIEEFINGVVGPSGASPTGCHARPEDAAQIVGTVDLPAARTYRVWSRVRAREPTSSFLLQVGDRCIEVEAPSLSADSWSWVSSPEEGRDRTIDLDLPAGGHVLTLVARSGEVEVDRVLFTSAPSCVPEGRGGGCSSPT
jgi:pectate lyase